MTTKELDYFCKAQSKLHSICIRIYKNKSLSKLEGFYGNTTKEDISDIPIIMTMKNFNTHKSLAIIDETQFLLGYVKIEETGKVLLIGPVRLGEITDIDIVHVMDKYQFPKILEASISHFLLSTPVFLIENFLILLSLFHFYINHKTIDIKEIMQENLDTLFHPNSENYVEACDIEMFRKIRGYEETIFYFIKNGMVDDIKKINFENYSGRVLNLGDNQLRSLKNTLVILNFLCLRASLAGGVDTETAYSLGEQYSLKIEKANSITELEQLSPKIRLDYCQRVKNLTAPQIDNVHILKIMDYIQKNIYKKITVLELADYAGISPEYLSALSSQHLHCTMVQYIVQRKIDEAKKLLIFTDKTLSEISNLLCFSSQSHFQHHFKKLQEMTPNEYRNKYKNSSSAN